MYNKIVSEKICILPWISLSIGTDGQVAPCCQALPAKDASFLKEGEDPRSSPNLARLRKQFLKGEFPSDCKQCIQLEKSGGQSMRILKNNEYDQVYTQTDLTASQLELKEFDVRLSNTCQLSCLTCEPLFSTSWYKHDPERDISKKNKVLQSFTSKEQIQQFLNEHSDSIEIFTFSGGEPLIDPLLPEFLKRVDADKHEVHFNTGLSLKASLLEKHLRLLPNPKKVKIAVSIDGIEDRAEKIRRGLDWNSFIENLKVIEEVLGRESLYFQMTCSNLNAGNIAEILNWINEHHPENILQTTVNFVHSPPQFNPRSVSPVQKEKWIEANNRVLKEKLFTNLSDQNYQHVLVLINMVHAFLKEKG